MPTNAPAPSWQHTGPAPATTASAPNWHQDAGAPGSAPWLPTRRLTIGLVWLAFLLFCTALVWVATWVSPPRTVALLLIGAGYEDNPVFSPNSAGQAVLRELAGIAKKPLAGKGHSNQLLHLVKDRVYELRTDSPWDAPLDTFGESTLLMVVSAHGASDIEGPFLIPTNADARPRPLQRLRMETVLDRLERLPKHLKIVLVLDVAHLPSHWPLGMLHNDFARGMEKFDERIRKAENLVVIVSSGPDQLSLASHDWQKTIFGHYLIEGLKGGADTDGLKKINAWELYSYTRAKVDLWARANRAAAQTPILLPGAREGMERARAILLNNGEREYKPADPEKIDEAKDDKKHKWFGPDSDVLAAWQKWRQLRAAVPGPQVYTPHLWQQYQTTLIQFESATRFADKTAAQKKWDRLNALERGISDARQLRLRSLDSTLAMPALTGLFDNQLDAATDAFLKTFWEARHDEDAKEAWDEANIKLWKVPPVPVRDLSAWMLGRLKQEKLGGLERAAKRLQRIRPTNQPLPAEAHWVVMMQRDLPATTRSQPEVGELFGIALELRLQAEECAVAAVRGQFAYSEQVQPWIAAPLAQADQERQFGTDLLIGTTKADWAKARGHFAKAGQAYLDVRKQADIVRKALATRDQVQSVLPAYSHWLARRPALPMDEPPVEDPKLEAKTLALWQELHLLTQLLESPKAELVRADPKKPAPLHEQTDRVAKGFAALEKRFDEYLESLKRAAIVKDDEKRFVWLETEAALVVPNLDVQRRVELLIRQHRISRWLTVAIENKQAAPISPAILGGVVRGQARREGDMALALLGKAWFDRFAGPKGENYVQVQRRLEIARVEDPWSTTIKEAGDQIGRRYRQMPLEIERLLKPAAKAEKAPPRTALYAADLIARRMEATLQLPDALDPPAEQRRSQLGDFLIAQTQRTFQDHWYDENPSAEPYYTAAARSFLADARTLIPAGKRNIWSADLNQAVASWEKKLKDPATLFVRDTTDTGGSGARPVAVVTSEQQWDREYRVFPTPDGADVPAGYPSLWIEDSATLRAVTPPTLERVAEFLTPDPKQREQAIYRFRLMSPLVGLAEEKGNPTPFIDRTPLKLVGLYRGQKLRLETPVDVSPEPTTVIRQYPLPEKASVAVRTTRDLTVRVGSNDSGIVFVLDCSGSMRSPDDADPKQGRYWKALQALRLVLRKVPKDTTVSIWTFGMAMDEGKTTRPELTIFNALKPTPWNPDSKQLDDVMSTLEAMEPWNQSPIGRALLFARDDLKSIRGNKTVVVITDGHDNRFDQDKDLVARYKDIPELLKGAFDKSGISLQMVFFPPTVAEEKVAQDQYRPIESFQLPGKIHSITDIGKLSDLLDAVMRQRLNYWIDRTGQNIAVNEIPETGLDVSTSDRNDRWFGKGLPPGGHKLRVNVPERVEKDVRLNRGDLLLLDLVPSPQGTMFERYLFSDDYRDKRRLEKSDWRLAVLQNQLLDKNALQMLVTLEKTVDRRETVLEQIKPRDVWIELRLPDGATGEFSTHWSHLAGYPAPAWSLDVPRWPNYQGAAAPPVLHAWWNPDEEARSAAELQVLPLMKEKNHPVVVKDQKNVVIESATIEKHRVEVKRGTFETRDCLVVRIRHEINQPILTRMEGMDPAGAEHRFYAKAGKYTGLYWFDSSKEPTIAGSARLRIIAVNAFKKEAEDRGYMLQMRERTPEPSDFRPRPPVELK